MVISIELMSSYFKSALESLTYLTFQLSEVIYPRLTLPLLTIFQNSYKRVRKAQIWISPKILCALTVFFIPALPYFHQFHIFLTWQFPKYSLDLSLNYFNSQGSSLLLMLSRWSHFLFSVVIIDTQNFLCECLLGPSSGRLKSRTYTYIHISTGYTRSHSEWVALTSKLMEP